MEKFDVKEFLTFLKNYKNKSYLSTVYDIFEKYAVLFRNKDFILEYHLEYSDELNTCLMYWLPFLVGPNCNNVKHQLIKHIQCNECTISLNAKDRLICIGNGNIYPNGIFIVGMAAGFYGANKYDKISFPFKPSFYFGEASEILRKGFKSILQQVYFTNLSKCAFDRSIMNSPGSYEVCYNSCFSHFKREVNILSPCKILAAGNNTYEFLKTHGIECEKMIHPASFLFKHQKAEGIVYYNNIARKLIK